jgi:hypothetical protein
MHQRSSRAATAASCVSKQIPYISVIRCFTGVPMKIVTVFVRFYKSFNFDYLRKYEGIAQPAEWEMIEGTWYPFVKIPLDKEITTVVGANESGKTHLLSAIRKGITGTNIEREDFCRYSHFFTVEKDKLRWPDFGFECTDFTAAERAGIMSACGMAEGTALTRCFIFRSESTKLTVYLPKGTSSSTYEVKPAAESLLAAILPHVIMLRSQVALPESIPIARLMPRDPQKPQASTYPGRRARHNFFEKLSPKLGVMQSAPTLTASVNDIANIASGISLSSPTENGPDISLACDLITKVAKIDPEAFSLLHKALLDGKEGYANGVIQQINSALAKNLNFPHWWVQDKQFQLIISPREFDLVFTIKDRTGTEYSFSERSSGLKYFLSYYIQYLAHDPKPGRSEILLMDEPDAYLSSQAQQDLLKIFAAYARPENGRPPVQTVYVTHSPFLIDKNHAARIRVLEKGVGDEGTRVVRDAARNHYEPLRSAFGAFVGETAFIGNCNLMMEGLGDQILIAGAAAFLQNKAISNLDKLDLNTITLTPAGSASHIPYLVYLARGRDVEKPAIIVLLDSDTSGCDAKKDLLRGGPKRQQLLDKQFILQIGDLASEPDLKIPTEKKLIEIEDLVPLGILAAAAKLYLGQVAGATAGELTPLNIAAIEAEWVGEKTAFDALQAVLAKMPPSGLRTDKVGLARSVLDVITSDTGGAEQAEIAQFEKNFRTLLHKLNQMQRTAIIELTSEKVSQRVERTKNSFVLDHPVTARREQALVLFEDIERALDSSLEADHIRLSIEVLRRDYHLDDDVLKPIEPYAAFRDALEKIKYAGRLATQEHESPNKSMVNGTSEVVAAPSTPSPVVPVPTANTPQLLSTPKV